jgi:hypothetical protein
MAKKKQKGFNWSGIEDNGDGTYTAESRIEKRRLLKSLHSSGYTVRSKQKENGSWSVAVVGTLSQVHRRRTPSGYRPKTRYLKSTGKYVPIGRNAGPAPRMSIRPGSPGASYPSGARPRSGNYLNRLGGWMLKKRESGMQEKQKQQNEAIERKKTETEINEKMRTERIEKERAEAARQVQKNEFHAKKIQFEEQQRERQRKHADSQRIKQARYNEFSEHREAYSQSIRDQAKINASDLQAEREETVT